MIWEYKIIELRDMPLISNHNQLNEAGQDEWELVCVDNQVAYFKRFTSPLDGLKEKASAIDVDAIEKMVYGEYEKDF